jgi:hypothetical protein
MCCLLLLVCLFVRFRFELNICILELVPLGHILSDENRVGKHIFASGPYHFKVCVNNHRFCVCFVMSKRHSKS